MLAGRPGSERIISTHSSFESICSRNVNRNKRDAFSRPGCVMCYRQKSGRSWTGVSMSCADIMTEAGSRDSGQDCGRQVRVFDPVDTDDELDIVVDALQQDLEVHVSSPNFSRVGVARCDSSAPRKGLRIHMGPESQATTIFVSSAVTAIPRVVLVHKKVRVEKNWKSVLATDVDVDLPMRDVHAPAEMFSDVRGCERVSSSI